MIEYVSGDATRPQGGGPKVIAHVCNDEGGWGAGFVLAVSRRWPQPEACYREWNGHRKLDEMRLQNPTKGKIIVTTGDFELGSVQLVQVEHDTYVANMIAQKGFSETAEDGPPIRYKALGQCLERLAVLARTLPDGPDGMGRKAPSFHLPRIGCGLAGGSWHLVGPIVAAALYGFSVTVYDL